MYTYLVEHLSTNQLLWAYAQPKPHSHDGVTELMRWPLSPFLHILCQAAFDDVHGFHIGQGQVSSSSNRQTCRRLAQGGYWHEASRMPRSKEVCGLASCHAPHEPAGNARNAANRQNYPGAEAVFQGQCKLQGLWKQTCVSPTTSLTC